LVVNRILKPL